MLRCPICDYDTKVIDSRVIGGMIRRKRECLECLTRFSSNETIIVSSIDEHSKKAMKKKQERRYAK